MNKVIKNLGIALLLAGFLCLVAFKFCCPENYLLVASLSLEFVGILGYIVANRLL